MSLPIFNNQGSTTNGSAITANGNFCAIIAEDPSKKPIATGQNSGLMVHDVRWMFTTGGTATGNVNLQALGADGTWRTISDVATIALGAALTYSGSVVGAFHGVRLTVSALAVATITYAELTGTVVTF